MKLAVLALLALTLTACGDSTPGSTSRIPVDPVPEETQEDPPQELEPAPET